MFSGDVQDDHSAMANSRTTLFRGEHWEKQATSSVESIPSGIQLREVAPVDVQIRNLSVRVEPSSSAVGTLRKILPAKSKPNDTESGKPSISILEDISVDMPSGSLTAIIGASGSGKTTLLDVLAKRFDESTLQIAGSVNFTGPVDQDIRCAYVMQQDSLYSSLTVRQTLQFGAELRLRDVTSAEERKSIVEQTILELSLKECASTRIGSSTSKGCSGGEKRRTSIGVQLLQNPSVLFCDEVTTGLDSASALQVVQTLKNFAQRGRTIIMTIHQPRSEIWELFDRVVVLSQGSCIYEGETKDCLPYFKSLGYEPPPFVNPAEWLIELAAIDNRALGNGKDDLERFHRIRSIWKTHRAERSPEPRCVTTQSGLSCIRHSPKVSFWKQFSAMTRRSMLVTFKDSKRLMGTIAEPIVVGTILGGAFFQLDDSLQGIRSRQGAFFTAAAVQGYLLLIYEVSRCCEEVPIFDREHGEGVVDVIPFVLSRRAAKALEDILTAFLYSTIFYFIVGLRSGVDHYLVFFAMVLLIQLAAVSVAMFAVSISRNFANASMVTFAVFGASNFTGGCFLPANRLPVYVSWLKWLSYIFYSYGAFNHNEFSGRTFDCPPGTSNLGCIQYSGNYQLHVSGISLELVRQFLAMVGLIGMFNVATTLILFFFPVKVKMSKKRQTTARSVSLAEKRTEVPNARTRIGAAISLEGYSLEVEYRKPWGSVHRTCSILKPLSTAFEPGKLNVIMGPSGSGKTTLLSSLAGRLRSSLTMRYRRHGDILFNGRAVKGSSVGSMVSLVTQEDDGLFSCLTVRETLKFAAALRLPCLSMEEKYRKAEEILLRMGLKDCADTLIGNDLVKGLSGGEKRRVSIAIQLLTAPEVLLLDEPTSGLDHFTAQSIMQLLAELAAEGCTVILTIHQNRSNLVGNNVLLLARGGHVAYSGPGENMLSHFRDAGYDCGTRTHPADLVLDLITIDLRDSEREAASRERVEKLISTWSTTNSSGDDKKVASETVFEVCEDDTHHIKSPAPFSTALPILYRRSALNLWRERSAMIARIMNVVPYGLLIALFFTPLHTDYQAVLTRLGLVQLCCFIYFLGTLNNTAHFPLEKAVMNREVEERAYSVIPFFVSFTLLEIPFSIIASVLAAALAAFPLGVRSAEVYFAMAFDTFALISCGESLALALNSVISDSGLTLSITNMLICVAQTMAGILSVDMPGFLKAINYISPLPYVARNLMPYFFRGVVFDCSPEDKLVGGECVQTKGEDILRLYDFDRNPRVQLAILAGVVVGYRLFAFMVLYLRKRTWD